MAKYRIKVEALDPAEELRAEYLMGIECDGFCIIGDCEDGHDTGIHEMSTVDLAECFSHDENLIAAACIAKGMAEARQFGENIKRRDAMSKLAKSLGLSEDNDDE